jgi:hypothetical protein
MIFYFRLFFFIALTITIRRTFSFRFNDLMQGPNYWPVRKLSDLDWPFLY